MNNIYKLDVWQEAINLAVEIYKATSSFPREEMYGLTSQSRRSAVSVSSNIAEGAGRNSKKEFNHFLGISNGSGCELRTQLIIANRLQFLQDEALTPLLQRIDSVQKMTCRLQQSIIK
jgi:four helix bundle protein